MLRRKIGLYWHVKQVLITLALPMSLAIVFGHVYLPHTLSQHARHLYRSKHFQDMVS
jgi:hypothetical protein